MTWWRRVFRQQVLQRELDAELRDHIEREVAEGVRAGNSEADVRRQIRLTSGGLDQVKEECRDVRRPPALADLAADVRFAWRILVRNGWATAGAILTLALAMGVANATFIITYATLWRDFPFERPDRIAIMRTVDARGREAGLSFADYQDWRRDARVFDGPSAAFAIGTISLGRDGAAPEQFDGLYVSADTFSVLRVKPQLGRDFSAADDRPGAEAVAIISSNIWKSRCAASRDVLGRTITVNGAIPATIVGVMPDDVRFIDFTDIWLPLAQMPGLAAQRRDTRPLMMIGRLPDGPDLDRVRAELTPIAAPLLSWRGPRRNRPVSPLVAALSRAGVDWDRGADDRRCRHDGCLHVEQPAAPGACCSPSARGWGITSRLEVDRDSRDCENPASAGRILFHATDPVATGLAPGRAGIVIRRGTLADSHHRARAAIGRRERRRITAFDDSRWTIAPARQRAGWLSTRGKYPG